MLTIPGWTAVPGRPEAFVRAQIVKLAGRNLGAFDAFFSRRQRMAPGISSRDSQAIRHYLPATLRRTRDVHHQQVVTRGPLDHLLLAWLFGDQANHGTCEYMTF